MTRADEGRRIGQNTLGRFACPTLAPSPVANDDGESVEPECTVATTCDRCLTWVCEEHSDDRYHECPSGIFCDECARGCPEPFCQEA